MVVPGTCLTLVHSIVTEVNVCLNRQVGEVLVYLRYS